ncbi:hypothetical protein [Burkholderia cepacia]|uniref:hypothetical protein n=1 Tax=Burkholderia cepacia TaxID=292 RepID=UPI000AC1DC12|nr:hypothetical protein [Burkholderia cepacia]
MSHGNWPKPLLRMRTLYWSKEVMFRAGFTQPSDFINEAKYGRTALVELGGLPWDSYFSGEKTPVLKTVALVEKVVAGTADLFETGPEGIPLWSILAGDIEKSKTLFNEVVDAPELDFHQRAIALALMFLPDKLNTRIESAPEGFPDEHALPASDRRYTVWFERFLDMPAAIRLMNEAYEERAGFGMKPICAIFACYNLAKEYENSKVAILCGRLARQMMKQAIDEEFEGLGRDLSGYLSSFLRH